jgi:hypothetical protein
MRVAKQILAEFSASYSSQNQELILIVEKQQSPMLYLERQ